MALVEHPRSDNPAMSGLTKHTEESTRAELWSEKDRQQQLLRFKVPEFISPYPVSVNKYEDTARKSTNDWLLEHGVDTLFRPEVFAKFVAADFPALAARVYIDFGPQALDWAAKFFTWLWTLDDQLDDTAIGSKRGSSVPVLIELQLVLLWNFPDDPVLNDCLFKFLDEIPDSEVREESLKLINNALKEAKNFPGDYVYDGKLGPTASCLRDLWASCVRTMPEEFNLRLAIRIQDYFIGSLDLAKNREDETIPTIQEYIIIRRKAGAVEPTVMKAFTGVDHSHDREEHNNGFRKTPSKRQSFIALFSRRIMETQSNLSASQHTLGYRRAFDNIYKSNLLSRIMHGKIMSLQLLESEVMADLFAEVCLPDELFYSPEMQQVFEVIADIISWHNDLFSFKKEFSGGDVHNLVALVSHERKQCSYEESALIALDMIYDRMPDLEKAFVGLLAIAPPAYEIAVQRYIKTCRCWISGSHAWHSACHRYQ